MIKHTSKMAEIWSRADDDNTKRLRLQATIFSQCFSPCGKYMAAGTNFGHVAVYSLSQALGPDANDAALKPSVVFRAQNGAVHCLATTNRLLISAGADGIQAWVWSDVIAKNPKVTFALAVPSSDHFSKPEINALSIDKQESYQCMFAGCGDSNIHMWDIDSGKYVRKLSGHKDYIHSLAVWGSGRECVSGSEDGTARIWDTRRQGEATSIIEPYKNEACARPNFGKWIGCVAVDKPEDWMVCGGGPHLCLWHLRSLTATTVFNTRSTHNTVLFQEDSLISAGGEAFVHHWSLNGEKRAQVPCSPTSVYNVAINNKAENNKVLSISGNCNKVDVCTNFGYKAFSLTLY